MKILLCNFKSPIRLDSQQFSNKGVVWQQKVTFWDTRCMKFKNLLRPASFWLNQCSMLSEWWRIKFQHHVDIVIQVIKHFYAWETTPVQKGKNYMYIRLMKRLLCNCQHYDHLDQKNMNKTVCFHYFILAWLDALTDAKMQWTWPAIASSLLVWIFLTIFLKDMHTCTWCASQKLVE